MLESVTRYLDEMEAPKPMIDAMVATGSAEIRWVEGDKDGLERPPSIAEWEDASCGTFTINEDNTYLRLMGTMAAKIPLTQQQQLLYNLLSEREKTRSRCVGTLIRSNKDRLPLP